MSRGAVPQPVRTHIRGVRHRTDRVVHDSPDDPLIDPSTTSPQEQRRSRMWTRERRASLGEPAQQGSLRRYPVGHCTLLSAFAKHPEKASRLVEIAKVEPAELRNAYPGRVQHLHCGVITQRERIRLGGTALRGLQCRRCLFRMQHRR
jgi:hypothetical protein